MQQFPPLLGFGFANLLMLGWLAAAAAPILIHLWNKRRYREVSWAAIEYLLAAMRKNSRRMWIEQWLLLLVRTLLVALIVVAVAQPFLERMGLALAPGERTLKVLVIDGSYSMAYKPTDKSRFERAKQLAVQLVEESSQGDAFALVLMAAPPVVVVGAPSVEQRQVVEEIEGLRMPHGGANLPATLAAVERIVQAGEESGLHRKEVYFLSDLGRNTWLNDSSAPGASDFRQRISRLARQAALLVVDLGQAVSENLAITSLTASEAFATPSRESNFSVQVRNFGAQPRNHHLVELYVDGRRSKETYVDVGAGEQTPLTLSHRFDTPGDHVVEVRLGNDLLNIDNHRWLSVPVKDRIRVLCVNGKPATTPMSGATDYLTLALNPEAGAGSSLGVVEPEVISESLLLERDLSKYDCVMLCNVAQFTPNEARVLASVLKRGGGLVFFLGDQVLVDRYNRQLVEEQGTRVLPARLEEVVGGTHHHFDPLGYRHPLVSVFQGREQSGLLTTPVYRYVRVVPRPEAAVALAFDGGDPAIVEQIIERGRSILVATEGSLSSIDPASRQPWTTMPAWPSFVPLVQEILSLAVRGQASLRNVEVGQAIGEALDATSARATIEVVNPLGTREEVRPTVEGQGVRWSYGDTAVSGEYRAELTLPAPHSETFAVNVDTAESDLTRLAPDELPREFTLYGKPSQDETESPAISTRSGLHKYLLYAVLGLLFSETFLAWWFGRPTR